MIQITDKLWVGNSLDGEKAEVDAVLNVARDLHIKRGHPDIEYMQIGLMDGPGNELDVYCGALLALNSLLKRFDKVLVHCHEGKSRSMAVAMMYVILKRGKVSSHPTFLNHWTSWDKILGEIREKNKKDIPEPHKSHKEAFDKLPLALLEQLL